eukprot:51774-Lingulodinium_polyedra.AAC.1
MRPREVAKRATSRTRWQTLSLPNTPQSHAFGWPRAPIYARRALHLTRLRQTPSIRARARLKPRLGRQRARVARPTCGNARGTRTDARAQLFRTKTVA